jgi:hypothetical protein
MTQGFGSYLLRDSQYEQIITYVTFSRIRQACCLYTEVRSSINEETVLRDKYSS